LAHKYKPIPLPNGDVDFLPILQVQISSGSVTSTPFEVIVDSGSGKCLFNGDCGRAVGIKDITNGVHDKIGGIVPGADIDIYAHEVRLIVGADNFRITAYFSNQLPLPGLLGRTGFFDKFFVTFDPAACALDLRRFHGHN